MGLKYFFAGVLFSILLMAAFAQGITRTIEVVTNAVNVTVSGQKVDCNTVLWDDTAYIPLRKVAEVLGKTVTWDGTTNTVDISEEFKPEDVISKAEYKFTMRDSQGQNYNLYIFSIDPQKSVIKPEEHWVGGAAGDTVVSGHFKIAYGKEGGKSLNIESITWPNTDDDKTYDGTLSTFNLNRNLVRVYQNKFNQPDFLLVGRVISSIACESRVYYIKDKRKHSYSTRNADDYEKARKLLEKYSLATT